MELRKLGRTDLKVTSVCLGTMTWGEQNTEMEAHEQLDYALDQGSASIDRWAYRTTHRQLDRGPKKS